MYTDIMSSNKLEIKPHFDTKKAVNPPTKINNFSKTVITDMVEIIRANKKLIDEYKQENESHYEC